MKSQQKRKSGEAESSFTIGNVVLFIVVFVWFLAVIKVFLLEYHGKEILLDLKSPALQLLSSTSSKNNEFQYTTYQRNAANDLLKQASLSDLPQKSWPVINDWEFIRSTTDYVPNKFSYQNSNVRQGKVGEVVDVVSKVYTLDSPRPASNLSWPPVLKDGTIPIGDGFDIMPFSGLKVPRFWKPEGDMFTSGSKVNGEETIFLMIASYRDFQCRETITSAFNKADHPERLFVGAVDQVVPGDIGCLDIEIPCSQDPTQAICKYKDQISIYKMDAATATGPVTARHVGDRMYRGQYFVMQMDAHCLFVRHWDSYIINQWRDTHNEMAVLSSYLTDVQDSIDGNGDSTRNTRPIMCNSDYEGADPARYLRHGAQPEEEPVIKEGPQLQPFWAAGFSFSRGHFKVNVPYDAYQPMVFQGEEIAIGIRGFTYGYDFYAPRDSVVFHEYAVKSSRRKKVHMFWENSKYAGQGQKSLKRATAIIGMAPDLPPDSWDHSEETRYGIGNVRRLDLFYKLFLIDTLQRKATQLCPFVRSGKMHREFTPFLRPNRMGIDYSKLENFDTRSKMPKNYQR